ncbi:uncharacterized protein LOC111700766 [Eurytemora carolleeae]|uniref:uncharacterized protein LOC111700766 n=1 Tax=Eurytemora carolleeae TaxID=1294199 RepID=UPI000C769244|nr:uncharacterized protein LOC111700766 [Eurytemora carolleeae]|eukprot:XP_023327571.1 uncharacterized protein LOC111700766 [Eurytemora affinis]
MLVRLPLSWSFKLMVLISLTSAEICPYQQTPDDTVQKYLENSEPKPKEVGCREEMILEKVHVPENLPGAEKVVELQPAVVQTKRCTGLCLESVASSCSHTIQTYRNISLMIKYEDGNCIQVKTSIRDESGCKCGCTNECSGFSTLNQTTCLCDCLSTEVCPSGKEFSSDSCDCVCKARDEGISGCWWKQEWSDEFCSCYINMSSSDYQNIGVGILIFSLVISILLNIKSTLYTRKLLLYIDENRVYGLSKRLLRNCAKIKPRQKTENGWEYGNTY